MLKTISKQTAADFLLDRSSEHQRDAIEASFIADRAFFEEILQYETELVDDYVAGRMSASDERRFARVALPRLREKVSFARALAAYAVKDHRSGLVTKVGLMDRLRAWFAVIPGYAYASLVCLMVLVAAAYWLTRPPTYDVVRDTVPQPLPEAPFASSAPLAGQIDRETSSAPQSSSASPGNSLAVAESPVKKSSEKRDSPTAVQPKLPPIVVTIVLGSATRGSDASASASLPVRPGVVRLQLPQETGGHRIYSIRVDTVDGRQIWQQRRPASTGAITANIPSRRLSPGAYIVTIRGIGGDGLAEMLNEYSFTIR